MPDYSQMSDAQIMAQINSGNQNNSTPTDYSKMSDKEIMDRVNASNSGNQESSVPKLYHPQNDSSQTSLSSSGNVLSDFDSVSAMPAAGWYLTTSTVGGLWYLEGQTVSVITDGGQHASQVVTSGSISLQYQASVVQVGLPYIGMYKSMQIEGNDPAIIGYN